MKTIIKKEKPSTTMYNPAHPGEILKELWLEPLGITITDAAERLKVTRKTLSKIVNGHAAVTPEMALKIEIVFGSTAATWLNLQTAYDIWDMRKLRKVLEKNLRRIEERPAAVTAKSHA